MDKYEIIRQLRVALPIYQRMDEYAKKMKTVNYTGTGTIVLLCLIPVLMFMVVPYLAFMFGAQNIEVMWGLCITIGIVGIVFVLIYSSKKKKNNKNQLIKEKEQFVQNNWCPELVLLPPDYRYFMACSYILSCFENMRADTMKEAINLYVEQLDRWRQEQLLKNIQAQTAQIQREQAASNDFFETAIILGLMR